MEQQMPHFSVVIAAFNSAAWIVHTIRSVLNQTYAAYEIIVIGDGCTDQTGDILLSNFGNTIRWENLDSNSAANRIRTTKAFEFPTGRASPISGTMTSGRRVTWSN